MTAAPHPDSTPEEFLSHWKNDGFPRQAFGRLLTTLAKRDDVACDFLSRPGISHSVRPRLVDQKNRPFFALIDVVEDPDGRWVSACFFADSVDDPDEAGEYAPGGLFNADALCFDLVDEDPALLDYVLERLEQARQAAR